MKIRQGFISNSSSSSFVVRIKDDQVFMIPDDLLANEEDIEKLKKYGFQPSNITHVFDRQDTMIKSGDPDYHISMKYSVVCNQCEVIYFLVKNNIPFKASCHYDQEFMSYKKDSDYILKAYNFGEVLDMYGDNEEELEEIKESKSYKKIPVKQFLKENYYED